jgi:polyribonucleotide nucleotidyltransferase
LQMVRDVTASAEIGKTYLGKVVRLAEFGAFVELFPGTDGLLHISEISEHRIRDVRDELKLGDQVLVKVLSIEGNKVRLSRKALIKEAREKQAKAAGVSGGGQSADGGASQHSSEQHGGSEQEAPAGHGGSDEHSGGTE